MKRRNFVVTAMCGLLAPFVNNYKEDKSVFKETYLSYKGEIACSKMGDITNPGVYYVYATGGSYKCYTGSEWLILDYYMCHSEKDISLLERRSSWKCDQWYPVQNPVPDGLKWTDVPPEDHVKNRLSQS